LVFFAVFQQMQQALEDFGAAAQTVAQHIQPMAGQLAAAASVEQRVSSLEAVMQQLVQGQAEAQAQGQQLALQMGQLLQQQAQMGQQQAQMGLQMSQLQQQMGQLAQQMGQLQQQQAQGEESARVFHRNAGRRASHARAVHDSSLEALEKEADGGAAAVGALPGPAGVPFPATLSNANTLGNAALDALAAFYHEDFGVPDDGLPARRRLFFKFIGVHHTF
jgi:septal ring factor EnvC (AmiA/AmiB activator)